MLARALTRAHARQNAGARPYCTEKKTQVLDTFPFQTLPRPRLATPEPPSWLDSPGDLPTRPSEGIQVILRRP